uniref:Methyltransferase n=1 Tax=candidate division WOR-3 bacterium TaxID=2052148 RepID=A0A7V1EI51_UNCW3
MNKLSEEQINTLIEYLKEGKPIPESYRWLLFEGKQETELIYAGKTREVDVLTETMAVPLQKVKVFGNVNDNEWHNMLIFGDNLQILKTLLKMKEDGKLKNPDGSKGVKLIYIDPPFGTGDIYGKGDVGAYSAKLMGAKYLEWLRQRIILSRELLSDDGSFYMRTDYHFGHYMKVLLDEIFGRENFRNEIVVRRGYVPKGLKNQFLTGTDSVFFYAKDLNYMCFNGFLKEISEEEREWISLDMPGERKTYEKQVRYFPSSTHPHRKIYFPPKGQHWGLSQKRIDELYKQGDIRINNRRTYTDLKGNKVKGMPEYRKEPYILVNTNWTDIPSYITHHTFFPTENSEQLLERIIRASSNEGDIVLDSFAGSGTTGVVAKRFNRNFIGIEIDENYFEMAQKRINMTQTENNLVKFLEKLTSNDPLQLDFYSRKERGSY